MKSVVKLKYVSEKLQKCISVLRTTGTDLNDGEIDYCVALTKVQVCITVLKRLFDIVNRSFEIFHGAPDDSEINIAKILRSRSDYRNDTAMLQCPYTKQQNYIMELQRLLSNYQNGIYLLKRLLYRCNNNVRVFRRLSANNKMRVRIFETLNIENKTGARLMQTIFTGNRFDVESYQHIFAKFQKEIEILKYLRSNIKAGDAKFQNIFIK